MTHPCQTHGKELYPLQNTGSSDHGPVAVAAGYPESYTHTGEVLD